MKKNIIYYLPFIIGTLIYSLISIFDSITRIHFFVWISLSLLFISGKLMSDGKWYGCIFGILIGILLIYMGLQETGQISKKHLLGLL